jgi:hypothetical protein
VQSAVAITSLGREVGRADLEDCLLETMTGSCMLHVRPDACEALDALPCDRGVADGCVYFSGARPSNHWMCSEL